jgi:DNA-binding response OmpR family regulator
MPLETDAKRWINLERVAVLALDRSVHGCKILAQILRGFGVRNVRTYTRGADAREALKNAAFDLIIADPVLEDEDGVELLRWLRRQERNVNRFAPIILVSGHSTPSAVRRSRDSGANFFVAKPLTASTLLERILWVARDKRPFVEVGDYLGPDRRFKEQGPPSGNTGRRARDGEIVEEDEPAKGAA